jgi:hypothetical protein
MTSEFTSYCNLYYNLTLLLAKREERLKNLLDNAPYYYGQTRLSEMDAIISYYRDVQAYKAKKDKTFDNMMATERIILKIMRHFEIPPGTVLTGEIPGELEYEIWADENDAVYISKTKDLAPEADNANIIVIKFSGAKEDED